MRQLSPGGLHFEPVRPLQQPAGFVAGRIRPALVAPKRVVKAPMHFYSAGSQAHGAHRVGVGDEAPEAEDIEEPERQKSGPQSRALSGRDEGSASSVIGLAVDAPPLAAAAAAAASSVLVAELRPSTT
jgi:hypothetical protein